MTDNVLYTDEALLQAIRNDDDQAFTLLYRRYWKDLFITASRALRGKEEAADVLQDVFLSIWNRRHELEIQGSLAAYLQTSVRYKVIHYIEKNITRRDYLSLLTDTAVHTLEPGSDLQLQLKQLQETIHKAVESMPPKMQEVYRLSRQEYLTHREIAERLSISPGTAKKHIHNALQILKTSLGYAPVSISIMLYHLLNI